MNKKQILLIVGALFLLVGIPLTIFLVVRPVGFGLKAGSVRPENVLVSGVTTDSAMVTWSTTSSVQGGVSYGLSAGSLIFFKPETAPTTSHAVSLEGLVSGSQYFFVIKIGEQTFDNNGQPYSFTTTAKPTTPTPPPLTEEGLLRVIGTNNATYDLNKDGIVNVVDLELLRKQTK